MSVKGLLESLGAPAEAVSWAADYGDDTKRAWEECEHPELLLPMAAGVGVPNFDVINACIEVVRANLEVMVIHAAVNTGLLAVERFICDEATDDELVGVLNTMVRLSQEVGEKSHAQGSSFAAVAHVCEAALMASQGCIEGMMGKLSTSVMLAAQARAETVAHGCSNEVKGRAVEVGLRGTAPLVRRYIPYESFVAGFVASMRVGKDGEDEYAPEA